jgi:hypothetical protein
MTLQAYWLSCFFFLFLLLGFLSGFGFGKIFLTQRIAFFQFAVADFDREKGFALPASERALKTIFYQKKTAIGITGRTFYSYLHDFSLVPISFMVTFDGFFVNVSGCFLPSNSVND